MYIHVLPSVYSKQETLYNLVGKKVPVSDFNLFPLHITSYQENEDITPKKVVSRPNIHVHSLHTV